MANIVAAKKYVFIFASVLLLGTYRYWYYARTNIALSDFRSNWMIAKICSELRRNESRELSFKNVPKPICDNILKNITFGMWVKNENIDKNHLKELDESQNKFRDFLGMPARLWRSDNRCGSQVPLTTRISKYASFCDPNGLSCCSDYDNGHCIKSDSLECKRNRSLDAAKLLYPTLGKWIVDDKR